MDLFRAVHDLGTRNSSDPDVIGFSDPANARNVAFEKEVLSQIRDSFFCDDNVRLPLQDVVAHESNFLHFLFKSIAHGILIFKFHVGLTFSLFVLQWAVEQDYPWVAYLTPHFRVGDILVDHDTVEYFTVVESTPWNFLNSSISLYFEVELIPSSLPKNRLGGLDSQVRNHLAPSASELSTDTALKCE
mgnify:CR=1 FL=1